MPLYPYQQVARNFIVDRYRRYPGSGLWLGCGLGKTAVSLHAVDTLRDISGLRHCAVIAPARVIATSWPKEIEKWGLSLTHKWLTTHNWADVMANPPDIVFISAENLAMQQLSETSQAKRRVPQLAERLLKSKFNVDMLIIDEVTKFKSWSAKRTKVLRKLIKQIPYRVTLTGSPTPNHLGEVFAQHYMLDHGETLSPYLTHFQEKYMRPCGYELRQWEMRPDMVEPLMEKLRPWYLCQEAVDHLDMPELIENTIEVELPKEALAKYKKMEKEMLVELATTTDPIVAMTGGGKYNLCRQLASGMAYDEDHVGHFLHRAKLDALADLYEGLNGHKLLVAYWYNHEGDMLAKEFPKAARICSGVSAKATVDIIAKWQKGEIDMILAQASTISHGIDGLQVGCNDLCWYTLSDNPDVVHQLKHRIYRQGNDGNKVRIHTLVAMSTIDTTVDKVIKSKAANQADVIKAIKGIG